MNGADLTPWLIRYGYEQGAFPMTIEDGSVEWFQPVQRCLFPISGIHVSRSLRRVLNSGRFTVTFDQAFEQVMRHCLRPGGSRHNWISEDFIRVYTQIHHEGWAHSCEVWSPGPSIAGPPTFLSALNLAAKGESAALHDHTSTRHTTMLVGGLYGLSLGSCFCAESMFHHEPNASKVALAAMVDHCHDLGPTVFDAQVMNPHLASLGAFEVTHAEYMKLLTDALATPDPWGGTSQVRD